MGLWITDFSKNARRIRLFEGSNIGQRVARLGDPIDGDSLDVLHSPRCATVVDGFSVHANVSIEARDRMRLERLCRLCGSSYALNFHRCSFRRVLNHFR